MTNRKKISVREQADAIAAAYLQKNPRKESYLVQIGPPEDDWREVSTLHRALKVSTRDCFKRHNREKK